MASLTDGLEGPVLVVNAGSSTLKLSVLDDGGDAVVERTIDPWQGEDSSGIAALLADAGPIAAVGHRVVHGGPDLHEGTVIDDALVADLDALTALAPLHQPRSLLGIRAVRSWFNDHKYVTQPPWRSTR